MHRGSSMSAHVLFNLFNKLGKRDKCKIATSLIDSSIQEHECYILFII